MTPDNYQKGREAILSLLEELHLVYEDLKRKAPTFTNDLPREVTDKISLIYREIARLRKTNLTIAFVGGFSAGKSSLINAFLGRYLLPESTEITTAVPTFVSFGGAENAELHYLNTKEVDDLDELYRKEIAEIFRQPDLINASSQEIISRVRSMSQEGRGKKLLEHFESFIERKKKRHFEERGYIKTCSLEEMQKIVCDESESMFLDHVEVKLKRAELPFDIQLVDLPGVSVPNPRHRDITFRFVTQDANAVVFVLLAARLFDRDEEEIVEKIRTGDSTIAQKTFWVLNRWDSLNEQQKQSTESNFKAKMDDFAISKNYIHFRTNALYGLLSQLAKRGEIPNHPKLQQHFVDYNKRLSVDYNNNHDKALAESEILKLQEQVFDFMNNRLRKTTLETAVSNTERNFRDPLLHHLEVAKKKADSLIGGELQQTEKETVRMRTQDFLKQRKEELTEIFREIKDHVVTERSTMFTDQSNELEETLRKKIKEGSETDAYEIYLRIIADNELRKFPYYFEIERYIVDKLNLMLKKQFLIISERQVKEIARELVKKVENCLESFKQDVQYDAKVCADFDKHLKGIDDTFTKNISGIVKDQVSQLDELLVYEPIEGVGGFLSHHFIRERNPILTGLEKAAKMQSSNIRDVSTRINKDDMNLKTKQIRETLEEHYIERIIKFRDELATRVWSTLRDNILDLEKNLNQSIDVIYFSVLEQYKTVEVQTEFSGEKTRVQAQSKRFREAIESIQDIANNMRKHLQEISL